MKKKKKTPMILKTLKRNDLERKIFSIIIGISSLQFEKVFKWPHLNELCSIIRGLEKLTRRTVFGLEFFIYSLYIVLV